jgi:hypothetical protein
MKINRSAIFCWLALLCFWVTNVKAAEKLVADYGGHVVSKRHLRRKI